jgi:hypothetical protein
LAPGVREFVGEKFDVTDEALFAVAHLMIARDDVLVFPAANGKEIHLRADLKDKAGAVEEQRSAEMTVTNEQIQALKAAAESCGSKSHYRLSYITGKCA